jgi:succinylglutamate desuccinylase
MYKSRLKEMTESQGEYSETQGEVDWHSVIKKQGTDNFVELSYNDKKRIHNLKYFTWIEQQGKDVDELNAQWYDENYWEERFSVVPEWDRLIDNFNREVGINL